MNRGEAVPLAIARPNVEGTSDRVGGEIVDWIKQGNNASFIAGVQILDAAANILESSKVAPAAVSARVRVRVRVRVCVWIYQRSHQLQYAAKVSNSHCFL